MPILVCMKVKLVSSDAASRGVLSKRYSENMQQIYRTPMPKGDFNKVALQLQ